MGGYGSGRKYGANCTDDYLSIDVRRWQRDGYLVPGKHLNWKWTSNGEKIAVISVKVEVGRLRLIYSYRRNGDDWESLDYPVCLQTTVCHYGGERYWFTCPVAGCGRRVAVLFLGDKIFACRHCYRLAYKSQREARDYSVIRKADKIRDKLNWEPGIANLPGDKPKGMHWKTYLRLLEEYSDYTNQALLVVTAKMEILDNRVSVLLDRI